MRKEEEKVEKNEISTQEKAINSNNPDMFDMFNDTLVNLETSLPTNLIK